LVNSADEFNLFEKNKRMSLSIDELEGIPR